MTQSFLDLYNDKDTLDTQTQAVNAKCIEHNFYCYYHLLLLYLFFTEPLNNIFKDVMSLKKVIVWFLCTGVKSFHHLWNWSSYCCSKEKEEVFQFYWRNVFICAHDSNKIMSIVKISPWHCTSLCWFCTHEGFLWLWFMWHSFGPLKGCHWQVTHTAAIVSVFLSSGVRILI